MKRILATLALALSTFSFADGFPVDGGQFRNIVNLNLNFGTTDTRFNPTGVLRPFRGDLLKVSVPASCGFVQIADLNAYGRTLETNQRLQLPLALVATEPTAFGTSWTYQVNGGQAATVRELGILVTTNTLGCVVSFEQANSGAGADNECNQTSYCPAHVDNTRYCQATAFGSPVSFVEDARVGADNSCAVALRLKAKICAAGMKPSQFQISCN